ncbi:MAG TPA: hypothetical protein VE399_01680 [Gemmatimonadales bacterium]|nr:hypothetical protein [Gemmatimonadales bacterium]
MHYCRYPAPACGSDLNPARARSLSDLNRLDIRQGSRAGRGALVGGAAGLAGSLLGAIGASLDNWKAVPP